jgi:hypothetical protein
MVDRTYILKGRQMVQPFTAVIAEAEMSKDDTVTLGEFTISENILQAFIVDELDGALLTSSISNNQVIMTNGGTNKRVVVFAFGVRV